MARVEEDDVGYALAANVANVKYEDLPVGIVGLTQQCILDTLGATVAGSGAGGGIDKVVGLVRELGGKEESSIVGHGVKAPAMMAAFANGAMAHFIDYDDIHEHAGMHATITVLPAGLAISERVGGVTGKEFLTTMAVGEDLVCRLAYSVTGRAGGLKAN